MQIHKNEITTGILVLATFGVLIAILVVIGMPGVIKPLNTYRIYYDNANGIRPGAPVLLAGREIGKVTALKSPVPLDKRPAGRLKGPTTPRFGLASFSMAPMPWPC